LLGGLVRAVRCHHYPHSSDPHIDHSMPSESDVATAETRSFWQPDVTVATIVVRDGALLMVEEDVQGRSVLNQPAGHLEPDESLVAAAVRETLEESGWDVLPTALVGLYQWKSPVDGRHFLRVALAADPILHHPGRALDTGILRTLWLTPGELQDAAGRHRSPLVWRAVTDYLAGSRHPLSLLSHLA
jgi:8-oxo-dGTP pyrophosphatase MutT (NUDIX family)